MVLYKQSVRVEYDNTIDNSRTAWIICVMISVSRAPDLEVKCGNAPTLCVDVVHVPTTPDALQDPPSWNPANLRTIFLRIVIAVEDARTYSQFPKFGAES